jgi:hypothetical protein
VRFIFAEQLHRREIWPRLGRLAEYAAVCRGSVRTCQSRCRVIGARLCLRTL